MQPLEMILGFNKDEGLHVIIDLLMDPTNDTNFRLVTLRNGIKDIIFGARCEKVGQPMDQKCFLTSMRTKSPKMWLCLQMRWFSLIIVVIPHSDLDVIVLAHIMIVLVAEFNSSIFSLAHFHRWPSSTWDQVGQRTMTSSTSRLMETNIAKGTTDPGVDCFDQ